MVSKGSILVMAAVSAVMVAVAMLGAATTQARDASETFQEVSAFIAFPPLGQERP
jgi:hypothetical protein